MKLFCISILLFITTSVVLAQETVALPAKEFAIALSQNTLEVKPGETRELEIILQRSRSYSKLKADMNLSSSLPDGIEISFDPSSGILENTKAIIKAAENATPGNYTIILNAAMNHKNKGAMLKLIVKGPSDLTTGL